MQQPCDRLEVKFLSNLCKETRVENLRLERQSAGLTRDTKTEAGGIQNSLLPRFYHNFFNEIETAGLVLFSFASLLYLTSRKLQALLRDVIFQRNP